jgi:hypothetical protein
MTDVVFWRRPDFLDRAAEAVSHEQVKRLAKLFTDDFFVIQHAFDAAGVKLLVLGSKRDAYSVTISEAARCTCSCFDAKMHARRHGCHCKHVCFVWFKILQADTFEVLNSGRIDLAQVRARLEARSAADVLADLVSGLYVAKAVVSFGVQKAPGPDDDCPICFDALEDSEIAGCPSCKNNVHVKCVSRWLAANAANKTCVYCRSPVWKMFRK